MYSSEPVSQAAQYVLLLVRFLIGTSSSLGLNLRGNDNNPKQRLTCTSRSSIRPLEAVCVIAVPSWVVLEVRLVVLLGDVERLCLSDGSGHFLPSVSVDFSTVYQLLELSDHCRGNTDTMQKNQNGEKGKAVKGEK